MASLRVLWSRQSTPLPTSPPSPAQTCFPFGFSPSPVVRICGLCRPLMRRDSSLLFRSALSTPNAACFAFFRSRRRTMAFLTVPAGLVACRAGFFICTTSPPGSARLLVPPWRLRLRPAPTGLPLRRIASRIVAGLPLILAWRRAASCSRSPSTSPCIHAASMTWVSCSYSCPGSSPGRVHGLNCCSPLGLVA
jgi:hypothetical protein